MRMRRVVLAILALAAGLLAHADYIYTKEHVRALFCPAALTLDSLHACWADTVTYTPQTVDRELRQYAEAYPFMVKVDTIGQSVEGRPLLMASVGRGPHVIFALGAMHGREFVTTALLMKDIECMTLAAMKNEYMAGCSMRRLLDSCTFCIVPMLNPDGVDIAQRGPVDRGRKFESIPFYKKHGKLGYRSWKANARGVDLNRNFASGWSTNRSEPRRPASERYKGPEPESEPETQALVFALSALSPEAVLSYHSQGEMLFTSVTDERGWNLQQRLLDLTGYELRASGRPYGSLQDHVDRELGVFYCCIELCPFFAHVPYPEEWFFYDVWPRAGEALPMAGAVICGIK